MRGGLREEQEAIFKNVITRRGNEDPEVANVRIIPTDTLTIPATDEVRPMQDLIADALAHRPDLDQARLQMDNSQIGLEGARSLTQAASGSGRHHAEQRTRRPARPVSGHLDPGFIGGYGSVLDQIFSRKYPTYGVGTAVDSAHPQPHRGSRPGARRTAGEAVGDPPAPVAEPGAPGSGRRADRHAPLARQLRGRRAGAPFCRRNRSPPSRPSSKSAPPPVSSSFNTRACWRRPAPPKSPPTART